MCSLLGRREVPPTRHNVGLGLSALHRIAAFAAISAKRQQWSLEQEFRYVGLVRDGAKVVPKERESLGMAATKTDHFHALLFQADSRQQADWADRGLIPSASLAILADQIRHRPPAAAHPCDRLRRSQSPATPQNVTHVGQSLESLTQ